ncbi:hypothetical protein TNCV_454701 [Trichonephila clavipes]|nr:hypothetical protein TNCV_454701 [Trichonephila clavipes]
MTGVDVPVLRPRLKVNKSVTNSPCVASKCVPYKDSVWTPFVTRQLSRLYSVPTRANMSLVTAANSFPIRPHSATTSRDSYP